MGRRGAVGRGPSDERLRRVIKYASASARTSICYGNKVFLKPSWSGRPRAEQRTASPRNKLESLSNYDGDGNENVTKGFN